MFFDELFPDGSVKILERSKKKDSRGSFLELYGKQDYSFLNLGNLAQVSVATSFKFVVRGLHMQKKTLQGFHLMKGEINAFFLDARPESQTFGSLKSVRVASDSDLVFQCTPGISFGYEALQDNTMIVYLNSNLYQPQNEISISFIGLNPQFSLDPDLHIMSSRDKNARQLRSIPKEYLLEYI